MKERIRKIFRDRPEHILNEKQVYTLLGIKDTKEKHQVSDFLAEEVKKNKLLLAGKRRYKLPPRVQTIEATIEVDREGDAYALHLDREKHLQRIFVNSKSLNTALNKDKVVLEVTETRKGKEGVVVEVIERKKTTFVGKLVERDGDIVLLPQEKKVPYKICVLKVDRQKFMANQDKKVIVEIVDWDYGRGQIAGNIVEVLGAIGGNKTEMISILHEFNLPYRFEPEVEQECEKLSQAKRTDDLKDRLDYRDVLTFTIDPWDAKDFDDAISFQRLEDGKYEVGVHIADVSHYLRIGSLADAEAYQRGTSVYLVDRVIPMLPEVLSNDLCSLNPNEDKLTFAVIFIFDKKNELLDFKISKTLIHSDRRFAYEEVQQIIESGEGEYREEITILNNIATHLRKQRFTEQSIDFDSPELKFVLDEHGNPVKVALRERKDAHKLIEDFMLLANKSVAWFMAKKAKNKEFVYRVHDEPDMEALNNLSQFSRHWGHKLNFKKKNKIPETLNKFMHDLEGKSEKNILSSLAIRAMSKAVYSVQNIGHYGLGFEYYTHFTSPIRRYPDLVVHRLVYDFLTKAKTESLLPLDEVCKHCSDQEKLAMNAERASMKFKQAQFLEQFVGQKFEGTVTGVTNWGLYVEINENRCEGLVRWKTVKSDYFEAFPNEYFARGRRTKRIIRLGNTLKVLVKGVNVERREIDLELV